MQGYRMRPERPALPRGTRTCFRCGIHWLDDAYRWADNAPCVDCRPQLAEDGVDLSAFKRSNRKNTRLAA